VKTMSENKNDELSRDDKQDLADLGWSLTSYRNKKPPRNREIKIKKRDTLTEDDVKINNWPMFWGL